MSLGGKIPPPDVVSSWPKPNYVDPTSQGQIITHLNIACITLGMIIVPARLYARFILTKAPGQDDAMVAFALVFALVFSSLMLDGGYNLGVGLHIWDLPVSKVAPLRLNLFAGQWCYTISLTATKISILLLYQRLSSAFTKSFLYASYLGIAYNVLYGLSYCLILLTECQPIKAYWLSFDPSWRATHINDYHCSTMERKGLPAYAALSVFGDIYSTVLPMILVSTLQLPPRKKQSLYALFALGFIVVVAGLLRTWYLYQVANATYDTSWTLANALFWVTIELYLSLLCACAPALKPLMKKLFIEPVKQQYNHSRNGHGHEKTGSEHVDQDSYRLSGPENSNFAATNIGSHQRFAKESEDTAYNRLSSPSGCFRASSDDYHEKTKRQLHSEIREVMELEDIEIGHDRYHHRSSTTSQCHGNRLRSNSNQSTPSTLHSSPRRISFFLNSNRLESRDVRVESGRLGWESEFGSEIRGVSEEETKIWARHHQHQHCEPRATVLSGGYFNFSNDGDAPNRRATSYGHSMPDDPSGENRISGTASEVKAVPAFTAAEQTARDSGSSGGSSGGGVNVNVHEQEQERSPRSFLLP